MVHAHGKVFVNVLSDNNAKTMVLRPQTSKHHESWSKQICKHVGNNQISSPRTVPGYEPFSQLDMLQECFTKPTPTQIVQRKPISPWKPPIRQPENAQTLGRPPVLWRPLPMVPQLGRVCDPKMGSLLSYPTHHSHFATTQGRPR